ncbi:MAG: hypothetical protein GQ574_11920 [Crocinitomix sp.]|nr:hypothetical protein [Crocinitomix sp.]
MKNFILLFCIATCLSCSTKLDQSKADIIGCWELAAIDGANDHDIINYINYSDQSAINYWGANTEYGFLMSSSEIRYELKLDADENILLNVYSEMDTTISKIAIIENSTLDCTVLNSDKTWSFKKIEQSKLDSIISSAIDPSQFNGY